MNEKIQRWDNLYGAVQDYPVPNSDLIRYRALLPKQGLALDVACGLGADALYLAQQGFDVLAWDASSVAIKRLQKEAKAQDISISTSCVEITPSVFKRGRFDLVYVHRYLDRDIFPAIIESLKPGGVLFYQTFTQSTAAECSPTIGPTNKAYRLATNELLSLCSTLTIKVFLEGFSADPKTNQIQARAQALIVATKPGAS